LLFVGLLAAVPTGAQQPGPSPTPVPAPLRDTLGRETPRGTVLGFMNAARNSRDEVSPMYLNTALRDRNAVELAHKLFVVLDRRLPPRLNELSERPEGSLTNPLQPDRDVVGSIAVGNGSLDIVLERVNRGALGAVWLFSRQTLDQIPDAYDEIDRVVLDRFLPSFVRAPTVAGIRLFQWLSVALLLPIGYRLTGLLEVLLRPLFAAWWRWRNARRIVATHMLPGAVRLMLLAIGIRWLLRSVELPLLERQFWWTITALMLIAALTWGLVLLNGSIERYVNRRVAGVVRSEVAAMVHLMRRLADALVVVAGAIVTLRYFGIDPTAALAGLGIGGIAVALAAQKTLENVIGGLSIIFDKAVRVGDALKVGDTLGTVDSIGLRSTRIRTLDRTIVSVPNGQIANVSIETLSLRDKFWFHHFIGLRYQTTASQLRTVVDELRAYLGAHPSVDRSETIRVRFLRFGPFSLDVEVFAYVFAANWDGFLETQQELLLDAMKIIERSGTAIALPAQTLHFDSTASAQAAEPTAAAQLGRVSAVAAPR
jgi:MscS family membrane protein